jgi:hypothetical protein
MKLGNLNLKLTQTSLVVGVHVVGCRVWCWRFSPCGLLDMRGISVIWSPWHVDWHFTPVISGMSGLLGCGLLVLMVGEDSRFFNPLCCPPQ